MRTEELRLAQYHFENIPQTPQAENLSQRNKGHNFGVTIKNERSEINSLLQQERQKNPYCLKYSLLKAVPKQKS